MGKSMVSGEDCPLNPLKSSPFGPWWYQYLSQEAIQWSILYRYTHRIHGADIYIYMVTWIPSIYPIHVSIYSIHGSCGIYIYIHPWFNWMGFIHLFNGLVLLNLLGQSSGSSGCHVFFYTRLQGVSLYVSIIQFGSRCFAPRSLPRLLQRTCWRHLGHQSLGFLWSKSMDLPL